MFTGNDHRDGKPRRWIRSGHGVQREVVMANSAARRGSVALPKQHAVAASGHPIPDLAIETLARGFCREASGYGFSQIEFVKFVTAVLEEAMADAGSATRAAPQPVAPVAPDTAAL